MASKVMSIWSNYRSSATARAITRLVAGNALAHLVTLIALPVVTRLYTPAEMGVISLFIAFVTFWGAVSTLRIESALLVAHDEDLDILWKMALWVAAFMAAAGACLVDIASSKALAGFGVMPWYAALIAAPLLFSFGAMMAFRAISLRSGSYEVIANATLVRSASNAGTRILASVFGILGLFIAEFVGYFSAAVLLGKRALLSRAPKTLQSDSYKIDWADMGRRYRSFIFLETPSVLVNQAALLLPLPAIMAIYGPAAAGWFGLARLAVAIPNAQIGRAVADVYQKEAAEYFRAGERKLLREHFIRYAKKLAGMGLFPYAAIMLVAPPLAPIVFGQSWKPVGLMISILAPWMYAAFVVGTLSRLLIVMEKQNFKLIYDVLALLTFASVFILAMRIGITALEAILLFSISGVLLYLIYYLIILLLLRKTAGPIKLDKL